MVDDVLCLSHLRWDFVYQRPDHLMSRCARQRRVFFLEEPVFDASTPRLVQREVASNLLTLVPHLPPCTARDEALRLQRKMVDDLCGRFGVRSPILWFFTPMALDFTAHVDCKPRRVRLHGRAVGVPRRAARASAGERRLFARADLVFTGGHSLYEAKRAEHPRVHAFPSSVDAAHFAAARTAGEGGPPIRTRFRGLGSASSVSSTSVWTASSWRTIADERPIGRLSCSARS